MKYLDLKLKFDLRDAKYNHIKFAKHELVVTFEFHDLISRMIFCNQESGFFNASFIAKSIVDNINDEYPLNSHYDKKYIMKIEDAVAKINNDINKMNEGGNL